MYEELKAQLQDMVLDNHWTGIYVAKPSLEAIEQLERQLAERDAGIAKYRDAPVVMQVVDGTIKATWSGVLANGAQLIVKPGER